MFLEGNISLPPTIGLAAYVVAAAVRETAKSVDWMMRFIFGLSWMTRDCIRHPSGRYWAGSRRPAGNIISLAELTKRGKTIPWSR